LSSELTLHYSRQCRDTHTRFFDCCPQFLMLYVMVWTRLITKKKGDLQLTWHWPAFVQPSLYWKINKYHIFWVWVCSLRYPACNAGAPYCHPRLVRLYNIFPHYRMKGTIFEKKKKKKETKKSRNTKCVFLFPPQILPETFIIITRNEWDITINIRRSSCKAPIIWKKRFSL
jgi:hypothetical protein